MNRLIVLVLLVTACSDDVDDLRVTVDTGVVHGSKSGTVRQWLGIRSLSSPSPISFATKLRLVRQGTTMAPRRHPRTCRVGAPRADERLTGRRNLQGSLLRP